jgi:hypothetical protein
MRVPTLTILVSLGLHAPWDKARAAETPAPEPGDLDGLCTGQSEATLLLERSEVRLSAFDSRRGLAALQVVQDLAPTASRSRRVTLAHEGPLLVPMSAASFHEALEAQASFRLMTVLIVRAQGNDGAEACRDDRLRVRAVEARLSAEELPIVAGPVGPRQVVPRPTGVLTGRVTRDQPGLSPSPKTDVALLAAVSVVADACLERVLPRVPDIRGALTVELELNALGERSPPKVVVDGVQVPALQQCLEMELQSDEATWKSVAVGDRVYVPLYFRDGLSSGDAGATVASGLERAASLSEAASTPGEEAGAAASEVVSETGGSAAAMTGTSPP